MERRESIHLEIPVPGPSGKGWVAIIAVVLLLGGAGYYYEYGRMPHRGEASSQPAVNAQESKPSTNSEDGSEAQEPETTVTEVTPGVFFLDFGGENCNTAMCLKQASELVLRQPRAIRILSVAAIGVYGSPTALVIVTGHTYE